MKSIEISCPYCHRAFPVVFGTEDKEENKKNANDKMDTIIEVRISDCKAIEPLPAYTNQKIKTIERVKAEANVNGRKREFTVYRNEEEDEFKWLYTVNGVTPMNRHKLKDFCIDDRGIYIKAWGVTQQRAGRHKFSEEEATDLAKRTGGKAVYSEEQKGYKIYTDIKYGPLLENGKANEDLIARLIKLWLHCWEGI